MSIRHWIEGVLFAAVAGTAHADACHDALARFDYPAAAQAAEAALKRAPDDLSGRMCLARAAYETGRFGNALGHLRNVEALNPQGEARTYAWNWLTVTLRKLGRDAEAWQYGQGALTWARREPNRQNLATALHNLAGLAYARGDATTAVALYRESIPLNPDLSERSASLNNVGLIFQAAGDTTEAERWLRDAIAENRIHGQFHHLGKHLMNLGNLYRQTGRYDEAHALLDEGAALIDQAGDVYWQAVAARYRGWLARDRRDWAEAGRWLALAARTFDAAGATADGDAAREELAKL